MLVTACESAPSSKSDEKSEGSNKIIDKKNTSDCTYTYNPSSTTIHWSAFKTTEKVAVGGTFDVFDVQNTKTANQKYAVCEDASFTIVTASINSSNEGRDEKLIQFFFNTMTDTDTIKGHVVKISETIDQKGTAVISLTLNDVSHQQDAIYTINKDTLTLSTTLHMSTWNAEHAITSLNNECKALHTGADGVSRLWDEVDVEISTVLSTDCQ